MENDFEDLKGGLDFLKGFEQKINGLSMDDPEKMMSEMGLDLNDLNSFFEKSLEQTVQLKYTNSSENNEPEYAYESDSGFDLKSTEEIWIQPQDRKLIPTGLCFDIPDGFEIQVRSKSGLALKQGLMVLNSPGTVDSGYLGEVKVIIFNTNPEPFTINKGMKVGQAVLCPVVNGKWVNLVKKTTIQEKDRGDKGFGSTGI